MSLDLPAHGETGWDVKLSAALTQLDGQDTTIAANLAAEITRATTAEAANASAITAEATARANAVSAEATARAAAITSAISALVNGAPGALDTLNELATALQADESAAATLTALVNTKLSSATAAGTYAPLAGPATITGSWTFSTPPSGITAGGVSASDVGYDVVLLAGQSNMSGRGTVDAALYDLPQPRVFQYAAAGSVAGTLAPAQDPLGHADRVALSNGLGPGTSFAAWYANQTENNRRVLLVPAAYGGTGFSTASPDTWLVSAGATSLYERAIAQCNTAIALAGENARLVAILWCQGEADIGMTATAYRTALEALIDGFRSRITGATASTPFLLCRTVPEFITANGSAAVAIDGVHQDTPSRKAYTAVVTGPVGQSNGDSLHYAASAQRLIGRAFAKALTSARALTVAASTAPGQPVGVTATTVASSASTVTWQVPSRNGSAITDHVIQYRAQGTAAWSTFTHSALTAGTISVTGLTNGTVYDIRVAAVNAVGTGDFSTPTTTTASSGGGGGGTVADTFTRANSSTSLGSTTTGSVAWSALTGTWGIVSNAGSLITAVNVGSAPWNVAAVQGAAADGTVQVTLLPAVTDGLGLAFRVVDANNYWLMRVKSAGGGVEIYKVVSGSPSLAASPSVTTAASGNVLKVILSGSSITPYVNGVAAGSAFTDATMSTATKHGMWCTGSAGAGTSSGYVGSAAFDDFACP